MVAVPNNSGYLVDLEAQILVTGGTGFIGSKLLHALQTWGFRNVRCLVRSSASLEQNDKSFNRAGTGPPIQFVRGNLLSREDCEAVTRGVAVIYHLAAGTGTKSFADAFMNSVVTTRNLLDGVVKQGCLRRFVNVSSFSVYTNQGKPRPDVLDESCPTEHRPELRGDAYCFAKVKQDELVADYGKRHGIPYVLVRPGVVYGPDKPRIHGRVGLDTFGIFLHLGGSNPIPFTFVSNCAEAIALAGLKQGIDGEVFNVVDDDLPSSRQFLKRYKKEVRRFPSIYLPHFVSYLLCWLWEKYAAWSQGQLPPIHNRREWTAAWKQTRYSNDKARRMLDWTPKVSIDEGLGLFFADCRERRIHA
jgi:nucleoside-diphosphate-sugar epimerase